MVNGHNFNLTCFPSRGGWFYRRSLLTEWLLAKGKKKSLAGNERSRSTDIYTCNCQVLWESFPSLWFAALSHQPTRPRYATRRLDPAADAAKCLCRTGLLNPSVSFTGGCCDEPHLTSHPPLEVSQPVSVLSKHPPGSSLRSVRRWGPARFKMISS